jgi:hypothetical protein
MREQAVIKKIATIIIFVLLLFTIDIYSQSGPEWTRSEDLEDYLADFDVDVDTWLNKKENIIVFEDDTSKDKGELLYNIGYLFTAFSFISDEPDLVDSKYEDYAIVYSYFADYKEKTYRLDVYFTTEEMRGYYKSTLKKSDMIVNSVEDAIENFKEKYSIDIDIIWKEKEEPHLQKSQSNSLNIPLPDKK